MQLDTAVAQRLFMSLPPHLQVPSLSPAYVAADARRDAALTPVFLAWRRGERFLMHAVHEASVPGGRVFDWQSPYGYGGPLAQGINEPELAEAWHELDDTARERKVVAEFVRFHPLAENHRHYPGTVREDRSVVAIDLSSSDLMPGYSGRARTAIRKAEKAGLRSVWEAPSGARALFPDFYRDGMRALAADSFYFFDDTYFENLLAMPEARVLSIIQDGRAVSMGLFLFGPTVAEYLLSATTPAGRDDGATNLLLHAAALRARDEGLRQLYLGGGTNNQDDNPLLRFKASFSVPTRRFRIGHRIHDPAAYQRLRESFPERARSSQRVLFYRG